MRIRSGKSWTNHHVPPVLARVIVAPYQLQKLERYWLRGSINRVSHSFDSARNVLTNGSTYSRHDCIPPILLLLGVSSRSRLLPRDDEVVVKQEQMEVRPSVPVPLCTIAATDLSRHEERPLLCAEVEVEVDPLAPSEQELLSDLPRFDFGGRGVNPGFCVERGR